MARQHTVQEGEGLGSIAFQYGLFPDTVWNARENAELRKQRDPEFLMPGDVLVIPSLRSADEAGDTGKRHRFRRKGVPSRLAVRLLDDDNEPRANEDYVLEVEGNRRTGTSDAEGWIRAWAPPDARQGKLILRDGAEVYPVEFGHVDPLDSISGAQAVLKNLGFFAGAADGEMTDETRQALEAFQLFAEVEVTGDLDDATVAALKKNYVA